MGHFPEANMSGSPKQQPQVKHLLASFKICLLNWWATLSLSTDIFWQQIFPPLSLKPCMPFSEVTGLVPSCLFVYTFVDTLLIWISISLFLLYSWNLNALSSRWWNSLHCVAIYKNPSLRQKKITLHLQQTSSHRTWRKGGVINKPW